MACKYKYKDNWYSEEEVLNLLRKENSSFTTLYNNLIKELETSETGRRVFEQVKRDYKYKESLQDEKQLDNLWEEDGKYYFFDEYAGLSGEDGKTEITKEKYNELTKKREYTLEQQQEEAIVELLGLMTAEKLDNVKDATLISKLKELWKQISDFVRSLLRQDGIKIDELPITTTLNDLAEIMAYGNNKIILPGYKIEYSTPLGNKYDTLEEVNNEISKLADSSDDVDLSKVKLDNNTERPENKELEKQYFDLYDELYKTNKLRGDEEKYYLDLKENNGKFYGIKSYDFDNFKLAKSDNYFYQLHPEDNSAERIDENLFNKYLKMAGNSINAFIEKNKEFEQSKEIIEQWKKENNIQYDPEEIYSRGQGFYSSIGAYSNLELDLLLKNLIQHIEDNKKAGGEFTISAFTKPIDKRLKHIEGTGDRVRFVIYPKSNHIKWAAPTDVYSGSVWDANTKISKDKKSELLGVSYTKSPSLDNINKVSPNLADIIDNLSHAHNELGIELTTNNFRIEYDDNIDYSTKKLIDNVNKILDDKYGKLEKPEIEAKGVKEFIVKDSKTNTVKFRTTNNLLAKGYFTLNNKKINSNTLIPNGQKIDSLKIEEGLKAFKQPTQTRENTTSIESVKSKLGINTPNNFGHEDFSIGDIVTIEGIEGEYKIYEYEDSEGEIGVGTTEVFYNIEPVDQSTIFDPETNPEGTGRPYFRVPTSKMKKVSNVKEKEYTSQAEINLKVAALKEVAKKYPRSLIRSEVKPISSTNQTIFGFGENNTNNNSENQEKSSILDSILLNEITFEDFKCK